MSAGEPLTPSRPVRFGLLGAGPWAERAHGPALAAHGGVELRGVWGRRQEAANALAETLGTRTYADVDALLADCDAIAVALPPDVQAPLAVRAANAGCHLLLEKPVATTVHGAREVAEAVERAGVASVVFFALHFESATGEWIEQQRRVAREEGGWLVGRADWLSPVFGGASSPFTASPWRREKGALWDVGPHALSVLLPLLGEVDTSRLTATAGHGDTAHISLRHGSGHGGDRTSVTSSSVTVSHSVPPAAAGVTAEVRGPAGIATLPERQESPEVASARAIDALLTAARAQHGPAPAHLCDARFGLRVTEILAAAEAALVSGDPSPRS